MAKFATEVDFRLKHSATASPNNWLFSCGTKKLWLKSSHPPKFNHCM